MPPITVDPASCRFTGAIPVVINGTILKITPGVETDAHEDVIEVLRSAGYTFIDTAPGDGGAVGAALSGVDGAAPPIVLRGESDPALRATALSDEEVALLLATPPAHDPLDHDGDGEKGGVVDPTPLTDAEIAALGLVGEAEAVAPPVAGEPGTTTLADVQPPVVTPASAPKRTRKPRS